MSGGPTVAVLMGGPDAEHQVSLDSGGRVAEALGTFDDLVVVPQVIQAPDAATLARLLDEIGCDVVFPVLHGPWGEGGPLQSMLEADGRRFVGSRSEAATIAMDKLRAKALAERIDLPTPEACEVPRTGTIEMTTPCVVKPVTDGSSIGVRFVERPDEFEPVTRELFRVHDRLMAERFVRGRELTVGIVGDRTLPIVEIVPGTAFYDYEAKYLRHDTRYVVDPDLPDGIEAFIVEGSRRLADRLGLRHLGRIDWLLEIPEGDAAPRPWFLEVNTMPGMTSHSLVPMAAAAAGLSFEELCRSFVDAAMAEVVDQGPGGR